MLSPSKGPASGTSTAERLFRSYLLGTLLLSLCLHSKADSFTPAELAAHVKPSVVTLTHKDRNGDHNGMGTGFVISDDGLVATSLHVIGEARPINIRFPSGEEFQAESIYAWDRKLDLAVIKIEAKGLSPLPLGDSDKISNGQAIVAIGNPMGLEQSVVTGVVSAIREFENTEMIQLAIPIEPGNSGGPLLDLNGNVLGLLNLKSTVTANLGFATPVSRLKPLLEKPNTVPMARWLRIGALNERLWESKMGAQWSQVTGRIKVTGSGAGFGGRALCLRREAIEALPFGLEVSVKLKDESGAAGLIFGADGGDRHYGFYPSNGQLRLTRFDGPDVFSWSILHQIPSPHYRPGDWNQLRINQTEDTIKAYLNGHLILVSKDKGLPIGRVGLGKFRDTEAEFKGFRFIPGSVIEPDLHLSGDALESLSEKLGTPADLNEIDLLTALADTPESGQAWLLQQARELEQKAQKLRKTSQTLHRIQTTQRLKTELNQQEHEIDLLKASLYIAKHDKPELAIDEYLNQLDDMAVEIGKRLSPSAQSSEKLQLLIQYLFKENGFHGSYFDYQNNANSYLDNVIDDREGLPITLSILFLELGRRIGVPGLSGFPLPFHFLVKHETPEGDYRLIDVFNSGETMTYAEANALVARHQKEPFRSELLESSTKKEIINRMLRNLLGFTQQEQSLAQSLPYLDLLIALNPNTANLYLERAWIHLRSGNTEGARTDLRWILDHEPPGVNLSRLREALESL